MGLSHRMIETPDSVNTIATDINGAYLASSPFVFLIGRPPT